MYEVPMPTQPLHNLTGSAAAVVARRRPPLPAPPHSAAPGGLTVSWARSENDIRDAQRLRYRVFVEEMGARIATPPGTPAGIDVDLYDPYCEHLLVRSAGTHGERGEVVGTYRVLTPAGARRVGGLYSDNEFDLTRLRALRPRMVELGRSCVHPDHRSGGVIMTMWAALGTFMLTNGLETMVGCASVGMRDGGRLAAGLWRQLSITNLAPIEWRVTPRLALPVDDLMPAGEVEPPALIKGYLRCGGMVLGAPAWDPAFNTADLPMLMRIEDLPHRYKRHFLGA
ncbi:MAG: GNAT family N-acetyltransferase [Methylibium sp.]|uniref:GNAT family N-acetyltransferase n=1 Tax=Methylibium sp. TaxID=2067992 RepID=UPI0017CB4749|nr:GNAT family N-acyltransferase [Methylibium sp.]MBA3596899.1 GNAT family N-acetyltransferase [Methylibium sp.]